MSWSQILRNRVYANNHALLDALGSAAPPHYYSLGAPPTIMYQPYAGGTCHGNFYDASYTAIPSNPSWSRRLNTPHPRRNALPANMQATAHALDSSNSSDALLMNIFCYPDVLASALGALLNVSPSVSPQFGVPGNVPLVGGGTDKTEIDMELDGLIVEAKFTEADFTYKATSVVQNYLDFNDVFEVSFLPRRDADFESYQLIRNVLAAHHHKCRFLLLCDARRPDLLQAWWRIHSAIRWPDLRARCGFLLWQEIARVVPQPLWVYLAYSRGIKIS